MSLLKWALIMLVVSIIADEDTLVAQWKSAKRFRGRTPNLTLVGANGGSHAGKSRDQCSRRSSRRAQAGCQRGVNARA